MNTINISNITKDYGDNKGVFDLSFSVNKGEVFGFLGPNGAGKTTTIRMLMGFIFADSGQCFINGLDCSNQQAVIEKQLAYLSGEIAFFDEMHGDEYLRFICNLKGIKDLTKMHYLIDYFEFNPNIRLKKMSKGMKQKIGLVAAFMQDADILILDEPTSGLDPLMQSKFIDLVHSEKNNGKTILMSSHNFEEVEKTCDRVAIIKNGKLVALESITKLKQARRKIYHVAFNNPQDILKITDNILDITNKGDNYIDVVITDNINEMIGFLAKYDIESIDVINQSLEDIFMDYYGGKQ